MNSKRTYTYNVVLQENDVCPRGELLTDKELERMKLHNPKRDWPKNSKGQSICRELLHKLWRTVWTSETISKYRKIT